MNSAAAYEEIRRQPEAIHQQSSQPALRSLPALAKVRERVVTMRDKARILREHAATNHEYAYAAHHGTKIIALNAVLEIIDEEADQEPEANT
jgi:hypothetical protein